jgi:hypothetical protein
MIREYCQEFSIIVPQRALSAGTLMAMGANEIVMTALAALGPIDPSRTHPLLPKREGAPEAEPISVQDLRHAMQFVREAAGPGNEMPYTPEAMAQIFTALFNKIHPLAIGAIEQTYALAKLIGRNCLASHMDPTSEQPKIDAIVDRLCDDYKSHAYPISRREAKAIGLNVVTPEPAVESAVMNLLNFYTSRAFGPMLPANATPKEGQQFGGPIAWLDSTSMNLRVQAEWVFGPNGDARILGDTWALY